MDRTLIRLGEFSSISEVRKALDERGIVLGFIADEQLNQISLEKVDFFDGCGIRRVMNGDRYTLVYSREVELVALTPRQIGLPEWFSYNDIVEAVRESDCYYLCQSEDGHLARLAYSGDEELLVVTEPLPGWVHTAYAFVLGRNHKEQLCLGAMGIDPNKPSFGSNDNRIIVRLNP